MQKRLKISSEDFKKSRVIMHNSAGKPVHVNDGMHSLHSSFVSPLFSYINRIVLLLPLHRFLPSLMLFVDFSFTEAELGDFKCLAIYSVKLKQQDGTAGRGETGPSGNTNIIANISEAG